MVTTQYGAILKEFEAFFQCPLVPDAKETCLIDSGLGFNVQIELDRYGFLLIGSRLGVLRMGPYRNQIARAALQSNAATPSSSGILGFSQKLQQLILFIKLSPHTLTTHQILTLMPPFMEKAKVWSQAIEKHDIPILYTDSPKKTSGLFGLIS